MGAGASRNSGPDLLRQERRRHLLGRMKQGIIRSVLHSLSRCSGGSACSCTKRKGIYTDCSTHPTGSVNCSSPEKSTEYETLSESSHGGNSSYGTCSPIHHYNGETSASRQHYLGAKDSEGPVFGTRAFFQTNDSRCNNVLNDDIVCFDPSAKRTHSEDGKHHSEGVIESEQRYGSDKVCFADLDRDVTTPSEECSPSRALSSPLTESTTGCNGLDNVHYILGENSGWISNTIQPESAASLGSFGQLSGESSGFVPGRESWRRLWDSPASDSRATPNWSVDESGDPLDERAGFLVIRGSEEGEERRWRVTSQARNPRRLSVNSEEGSTGSQRACPSGFHSDGECDCESFVVSDETSRQTSISRIVMLAEALFEVLDEIQNQSAAFSRSASVSPLPMPAPDSIVNSFPVRIHKELPNTQEDAEQCYICLVDYEEGDRIRVLPCNHEYHMDCVDKWLKEVHRLCPLCRANVCESNLVEAFRE